MSVRAAGGTRSVQVRSQSGGQRGQSGRHQGHSAPYGPRPQESISVSTRTHKHTHTFQSRILLQSTSFSPFLFRLLPLAWYLTQPIPQRLHISLLNGKKNIFSRATAEVPTRIWCLSVSSRLQPSAAPSGWKSSAICLHCFAKYLVLYGIIPSCLHKKNYHLKYL